MKRKRAKVNISKQTIKETLEELGLFNAVVEEKLPGFFTCSDGRRSFVVRASSCGKIEIPVRELNEMKNAPMNRLLDLVKNSDLAFGKSCASAHD